MSLVKVILIGNLTKDPEAGQLPNGGANTSRFTIATNVKVKGEDVATFFRVSFFGKQADVANTYLSKGKQVYVEGNLHLETYTATKGANEGKTQTSLEVSGTQLQLIDRKVEGDTAPAKTSAAAASGSTTASADDDIPF